MVQSMNDDSSDFARRLRVVMANDDIGAEELSERLYSVGIRNGTRGEPVSAATIRRWCRQGLKWRSDWLHEALAKVTSGSVAYFRGDKPINFSYGPVAHMCDTAMPCMHIGEPGGARTLDTRIKSPVFNTSELANKLH